MPLPKFALLSDGKLYFVDANGHSTSHESRFAKEAMSRVERTQVANRWKDDTDAWNNQSMMMPGLAGFQNAASARPLPQFTGITSGRPNQVCYSMDVFGAGGLFVYDFESGYETRLMHRNEFDPDGLIANPSDGRLAFSLRMGDGTSHLKIKEIDSPRQRQLTDGDTCDECPWWHTSEDQPFLYFHSTPIGRNQQGFAVGRGPGQLCRIGVESGDVETLVADQNYDFLHPRLDGDGTLYAIRRKYESPAVRNAPSLGETLKDFALLPYRFLRMLFFFANFMSLMFVGKPLTSEMIQETPEMQAQRRVVWGRALQTQKRIRSGGQKRRMRLVPDDWELVKFDTEGNATQVVNHVLAFDITPEGEVIYSDGGGVFLLGANGDESRVCDLVGVTRIATIRTGSSSTEENDKTDSAS